ncbi:MAG: hypothetical protein COY98_00465 [Candidatus Yonathbacteria bacterium CG_4_10_14_0_8_um_filter_43_17]|uniref:Uncharacterized protein n=1 Tax=Candidatus Yonathbacteria bacterium CG_4_10_14_0_8_um_filter_43_17 TaxID=1975099 RepID=A0A2M7Q5K5_9BACT|nr:MAG: hypothetical protein COY98_00465 [Candidatus Yonathbacteria bacterium CG_4_10_14_0_8_um_filter_43_17]
MDQNNESPEIVFESDEFQQTRQSFQTATPKIVEWVIKYSGGLVKDEKQASYVLIGFVVVAIIVSLFLIFGGGDRQQIKNINPETGEEIIPGQVPGGI